MSTETIIKQRPILFSTPMVQAILEGRKTQTRRIIKPQPRTTFDPDFVDKEKLFGHPAFDWNSCEMNYPAMVKKCPYGKTGDELWVRETWASGFDASDGSPAIAYKADCPEQYQQFERWKPSIHMPKDACRLRLEITSVRAERLQVISQEDAFAEGVYAAPHRPSNCGCKYHADMSNSRDCGICSYKLLWTKINGLESWQSNPWVWVISFRNL